MTSDTGNSEDERIDRERTQALQDIVLSDQPLKVVAAGPGTGKTYTLREVLKVRAGDRLVLSFINDLVRKLQDDMGDLAEVKTFHAFCKSKLHRNVPEGLTSKFDYYPHMDQILRTDAAFVLGTSVSRDDFEAVFHLMDAESEVLRRSLSCANYYNAAGHLDAVYRLMDHFERNRDQIPVYSQVVVDEFQDFSPLEVRFIELLAEKSPMFIVGDDDQALYDFKHASPEALRKLVREEDYESFSLPFSTRCTQPLVDSTNEVIKRAQAEGLLEGRIEKPFGCYLPKKRSDSERYPHIIHAACTRQDGKSPIMQRYIEREIRAIPAEDLEEAQKEGYLGVLVTGPGHYLDDVREYLADRFDNVLGPKEPSEPLSVDGYKRLLEDPSSHLGWRILCLVDRPRKLDAIVRTVMNDGGDLRDCLPEAYRNKHLENLAFIARVKNGEDLSSEEQSQLEEAVRMTISDLRERLGLEPDEATAELVLESQTEDAAETLAGPPIMVCNLVRAKGLQAGHVFVVGLNEGGLPSSNADPEDLEVCKLVVALTRATKRCHLLSVMRFKGDWVSPSVFLDWVSGQTRRIDVKAGDFKS